VADAQYDNLGVGRPIENKIGVGIDHKSTQTGLLHRASDEGMSFREIDDCLQAALNRLGACGRLSPYAVKDHGELR
jgi:hypothetical protein